MLEPIWRGRVAAVDDHVLGRLRFCLDAMAGNFTARPTFVRDGELVALDIPLHTRFAARALQDQLRALAPEVVLDRLSALERERGGEPTVACHIGEVQLWLGRYDAAHDSFARAIAATPEVRWAYVGLCAAALCRGEHHEAIAWCQRGIDACPPPGRTMYAYRGEVYRRMGELESARADFERAHALTPNRISAWINMALLHPSDQEATLARLERRAPGLIADALAERGRSDLTALFDHMLHMMRGNRSSTFVTYHTADDDLRFVPMPER
jgi:tetratricopeptide (TPR) repeat protein